MQPDETDWKIIELMRRDGLLSNNAIARELNVSEGMIRRRVQRLRESGALDIKALLNPQVLANQQLALVAVNVEKQETLQAKAEEIAALDEVLSVSILSGRYDLVAEVLVESNHGLVEFLTDRLPTVHGLSKTESFLLLRTINKFV